MKTTIIYAGKVETKKTSYRPLYIIAQEIKKDWKKVYFGAVPYLNAMSQLIAIDDRYMFDSAKSIVMYFLSNAQTWRGETAKRVKKELNDMTKKELNDLLKAK
jgi:hypothetical protein